jgi:hypothetical protein
MVHRAAHRNLYRFCYFFDTRAHPLVFSMLVENNFFDKAASVFGRCRGLPLCKRLGLELLRHIDGTF